MKKIKAFTLMELIIGMIVGSIVVGFCYTGYSMIFSQYLDYKKTKQQVSEAMQLNEALSNDLTTAAVAEYKDHQLVFTQDSSKIEYEFNEAYILRKTMELTDTFHFEPQDIAAVFLNVNEEEETEIVESFSFKAGVLKEAETFQFTKKYSAEFLMQQDKKQSHGN